MLQKLKITRIVQALITGAKVRIIEMFNFKKKILNKQQKRKKMLAYITYTSFVPNRSIYFPKCVASPININICCLFI